MEKKEDRKALLHIERVDHVSLVVADPDSSALWYMELLGMQPAKQQLWWRGPGRFIEAGGTMIAFFPPRYGEVHKSPLNQGPWGCHIAFRVNRVSFQGYQELLDKKAIRYEYLTHTHWHSLYFSDPDGYTLEITTYDV